jgi:MtrB/PioB family decaheme-associated outer membrane protein
MMKLKIIIYTVIISLIPFFNAASEELKFEGQFSVTGQIVDVNAGEGGEAKFTEYKDLKTGVYGEGILKLDSERYFLNLEARDIAYDTQYYRLDGGMWEKFKYDLFYYEIPHNITFDARTFFHGASGFDLTGSPSTNVGSWNTFDYSTERKKYGAGFKLDMIKPFYFDVSYSREEKDGIKPAGIPEADAGGIAVELPEPIDFRTNDLRLEVGYAKNPLFLSLNYFYSDFNNKDETLSFTFPGNSPLTLPSDNKCYKLAFNGALKLPLNSKFNANFGTAKTTSEPDFFPSFDGKVKTYNYDFILTSNPVSFFDGKVFYKYYKRDNKSTESANILEHTLSYRVNTFGVDLGFRLPERLYLIGGYKYVKTKREGTIEEPIEVLPFNKDNIYSVDLKWSGLDFATLRVGYERLDRGEDFQTSQSSADLMKRFAYAAQDRDTFKASVDIFPLDNLNFGIGYQYKTTDYNTTKLGLKKDKRNEFDINADYTIKKIAKLFGYFDYEKIKLDQSQRAEPGNLDWNVKQNDKTYEYGIGTEIYAIPEKLTFKLQHDYVKANGNANYDLDPGLFSVLGISPDSTIDISNWDDYRLRVYKVKAIYYATKSLIFSVGYAYENFKYSDAQLDDYQFVPATSGSNGAYLTGAYKDQSYSANIVFAGITYKF